MIDKCVPDVVAAFQGVPDAAALLLGGFGVVGPANSLIEGLLETVVKNLTVVANNAGYGNEALIEAWQAHHHGNLTYREAVISTMRIALP